MSQNLLDEFMQSIRESLPIEDDGPTENAETDDGSEQGLEFIVGPTPIPLSISDIDLTAQDWYPRSITISMFKEDSEYPALCRMVYFTFNQKGAFPILSAGLAIDEFKYDELSQSKRTAARGSVSIKGTHLFQDLKPLLKTSVSETNESIGRWVFNRLQEKGVTDKWGVQSYDELHQSGKKPVPLNRNAQNQSVPITTGEGSVPEPASADADHPDSPAEFLDSIDPTAGLLDPPNSIVAILSIVAPLCAITYQQRRTS